MEDLDGRRLPEWIVPNHGSGAAGSSVLIYSFIQGRWELVNEVDCGFQQHEVAVVDFDQDGTLDLAAT